MAIGLHGFHGYYVTRNSSAHKTELSWTGSGCLLQIPKGYLNQHKGYTCTFVFFPPKSQKVKKKNTHTQDNRVTLERKESSFSWTVTFLPDDTKDRKNRVLTVGGGRSSVVSSPYRISDVWSAAKRLSSMEETVSSKPGWVLFSDALSAGLSERQFAR